jgi:hypothetical protein
VVKTLLFDNTFYPNSPSTVAGQVPKYLQYTLDPMDQWEIALYTEEEVFRPRGTEKSRSYGLVFESPAIKPHLYGAILKNVAFLKQHYHAIFTYHPDLIAAAPGFFLYAPAAGVWGRQGLEIEPLKTNRSGISMIASGKEMCEGHLIRNQVARELRTLGVDVFGKAVGKPIINVSEGIHSYAFHIAIENCVYNNYFTEKLLNCFVSQTIPIYCGCPNLSDFFDTRGIIHIPTFEKISDKIEKTIRKIRSEGIESWYDKLVIYSDVNRAKALRYTCIEDYICEKYLLGSAEQKGVESTK